MNSLEKAMGYLMAAVVLAAFALPASASNKLISLAVNPEQLGAGPATVEVFAKITNTGSSTANSFQIDWKVSEQDTFKVVSASVGSSTGVFVSGLQAGYEGAVFTNQPPLARRSSVTIKLIVEVAGDRCTSAWIDWFAYAWTGSPSSPSQSFTLAPGVYRTTSAASCSIRFGTQPANAFVGSTITGEPLSSESDDVVTVELLRNGSVATGATDSVNIASTCAATADTPAVDGVASLSALKATLADPDCVLTATAPSYSGTATVDSNQFKVLPPSGDLACGGEGSDGGASLRRLFNADDEVLAGSNCEEIPYSLDFDGKTLTFLADYSVLEPGVEPAFEFDVTNDPEIVSVPDYLARAAGSTLPTFAGSVPLSIQWFDDDTNRFVLDFCPGTVAYDDVSHLLVGVTFPAGFDAEFPGPNDMSPDLPGFQYGCLVDRKIKVVEPSECGVEPETMLADEICVEVREVGYLRGDYTRTRVF